MVILSQAGGHDYIPQHVNAAVAEQKLMLAGSEAFEENLKLTISMYRRLVARCDGDGGLMSRGRKSSQDPDIKLNQVRAGPSPPSIGY